MQETVLTRIVNDKHQWVAERRQKQPLESFRHKIEPSSRSFYQALTDNKAVFILECKKASPQKGLSVSTSILEPLPKATAPLHPPFQY